jgi:hypothetical protein
MKFPQKIAPGIAHCLKNHFQKFQKRKIIRAKLKIPRGEYKSKGTMTIINQQKNTRIRVERRNVGTIITVSEKQENL